MPGFCLKVMIHFLRGILHSLYENLAQRYDTKECHIGWKQRLMRNMLLPLMTKQVLCFNMPKKTKHMFILPKHYISLDDAGIAVRNMQHCLGTKRTPPVNQKCSFLLFTFALKTCSIEANATLLFEHGATVQNWIISDMYALAKMRSFIEKMTVCIFLPTDTYTEMKQWWL